MVKHDAEETAASPEKTSFNKLLTGERLIQSASQLLATDTKTALDLARISLNYPASSMLTYFLYQVAAINQAAAD